jgi:alpha-mannosidase
VPKGATFAQETNLMEKPEGGRLPVEGDVVTLPIKPYEILTVEVGYSR